ncbi:MAG: PaaX domain-containing protein, C- domain protein [Actinobacteria bacterium]|nr:PaaX domain-containing protein, C- domain protein [Actinomycetota bacterium]
MSQSRNGFSARSVVASTLLGAKPPVLPVRVLVRSAGLFGIAEGTVRVALSRMVAAGELTQDDDGPYRLTGHLLERQVRQEAGRRPRLRRWSGRWTTAVVVATGRAAADRAALRSRLARQRMGELREGVWLRPDNLAVPADDECLWGAWRPDADPVALARSLWDVDGWAADADVLRTRLAGWTADAGLAAGFVLSADVLRHFNADPLLPAELLPPSWPGDGLRADYEAFDAEFLRVWRSFMG